MNSAYHIQKYIPDSLAIGDDGCSNAVLYAKGSNGFGVYMVSFGDLDANEMVYIADSLEAFFVKEEGIDIYNNVWQQVVNTPFQYFESLKICKNWIFLIVRDDLYAGKDDW